MLAKITHYDFLRMSEAEQYEAIWQGTFLGDRHEGELCIQCYSLTSFYVEVYYDRKVNQIQRIRSFSRLAQLAPYLKLDYAIRITTGYHQAEGLDPKAPPDVG